VPSALKKDQGIDRDLAADTDDCGSKQQSEK
jgi:hypothetical protein